MPDPQEHSVEELRELVAVDNAGELLPIEQIRAFRLACLETGNVQGALDAENYCATVAKLRMRERDMTAHANRWNREAVEFGAAVGLMLGPDVKRRERTDLTLPEASGSLKSQTASDYRALARVPEEKRQEFYEQCEEKDEQISKAALRRLGKKLFAAEDRAARDAELAARDAALPKGRFSLIYADPPWRYEHVKTDSRAIENQYPTMDLEEICALGVDSIAADDCVLFLWTTSPKLAESMRVIDSWGFTYRTCMVWVKHAIGMGYYARQRHELLLIATRGEPGTPAPENRPDSVISYQRAEHSAKPLEVYAMLESMYPHARRVELFSRVSRDGWAAWGNQSGAA